MPWINSPMPNRKTDTNNGGGFSTDFIGQNHEYPSGNYAVRERIAKAHRRYQEGFFWTLANHPRVPEAIRAEAGRWGLARDEFTENGNWPEQLYVREARRMIGGYVMTQHNCERREIAPDSIGLAAYTMDSHNTRRYVDTAGFVRNEGNLEIHGIKPYPVSYRAIVPDASECENLLVPVCLSASHIAYGSIRMEPVFMVLGQSAAFAADMAIRAKSSVQRVDYVGLRRKLLAAGQILDWTPPEQPSAPLPSVSAKTSSPPNTGNAGEGVRGSMVKNPILPGFNPDPGFVRIGEDYYIVTSSFEHFPALPIYHSRDLAHWRQSGHVIDRPSQIDFSGIGFSGGLFSPVLRHHDGVFYLTFTVLRYLPAQRITNYLVTAPTPAGPWSEPVVLTDDDFWRIDTSLFFDDDGRAWFTANRKHEQGRRMVVLSEIDVKTGKLFGARHGIGSGGWPDSRSAEGAHIYKRDGWYYLLMAEGGTGRNHAFTISRARKITGPYEQCPANPILTHRDLPEAEQAVWAVGHGEIVFTPRGDCWLATLARRGSDLLGRETFLVPMRWEPGQWPVVAAKNGRIPAVVRETGLRPAPWPETPARNEFEDGAPDVGWMWIRPPANPFWSLRERPGWLRLRLLPETILSTVARGTPAFIARRLAFHDGALVTRLDFSPRVGNEFAGLLLRRGTNTISLGKTLESGTPVLRVQAEEVTLTDEGRQRFYGEGLSEGIVAGRGRIVYARSAPARPGAVYLKAECRDEIRWRFSFSDDGREWHALGEDIDASLLGAKAPGGTYTGTMAGVYATSGGQPSDNRAEFDFFELREQPANQ
ncbi:MAG: family 43 glycosylhydrolase [Opitutaceae bacterium]|jgi:alpha-N-arabinofuranosidase|nr:family 43 glycosylhydrolase [Opitutaceae bacterium]